MSTDDVAKADFLDATGTNVFDNLIDGDEIWNRFGISQQRTYVYLNDDGTFVEAGYGSLRDDVVSLIAQ